MNLNAIGDALLAELRPGLAPSVLKQVAPLAEVLADANKIVCYGVGREGLMMKAVAMRLFHLGLDVHVVGDMTVPAIESGDVFFISAGPGYFSTVEALVAIARQANAMVICVTADSEGTVPRSADFVVVLPGQTMAQDQGHSIWPMGSLYEALMFVFFEILILYLRDHLGIVSADMRANHTNLE